MSNIQLTAIKGVENTSTSIAYINQRNSPCVCYLNAPSTFLLELWGTMLCWLQPLTTMLGVLFPSQKRKKPQSFNWNETDFMNHMVYCCSLWVRSSTCLAPKQNKNLMDSILETTFKVAEVKKSSQVNSDNLWRGPVEVRFTEVQSC